MIENIIEKHTKKSIFGKIIDYKAVVKEQEEIIKTLKECLENEKEIRNEIIEEQIKDYQKKLNEENDKVRDELVKELKKTDSVREFFETARKNYEEDLANLRKSEIDKDKEKVEITQKLANYKKTIQDLKEEIKAFETLKECVNLEKEQKEKLIKDEITQYKAKIDEEHLNKIQELDTERKRINEACQFFEKIRENYEKELQQRN